MSHDCPRLPSGPACPPISSYLLPPADPSRQLPDLALGENPSRVPQVPLPFLRRAFSSLALPNTIVPSRPGSSLRVVFIPCDSPISNGPSSVQTSLCSPFSAPCWVASQEEAAQAPRAISWLAQVSAPQPVTSVYSLGCLPLQVPMLLKQQDSVSSS